MIRNCPRCELRFEREAELQDHLSLDHSIDPGSFERYRYPAATPSAGSGRAQRVGLRRYLVVANQTLGGSQVTDEIRERVDQGAASFYVLVPATHSFLYSAQSEGAAGVALAAADDKGLALARWRLRTMIDRLREAGIDAEGEVGHPDPFTAVSNLLARESFDEVIVSTLPPGASRWLNVDLPKRVEHHFGIPVTTVVGGS